MKLDRDLFEESILHYSLSDLLFMEKVLRKLAISRSIEAHHTLNSLKRKEVNWDDDEEGMYDNGSFTQGIPL